MKKFFFNVFLLFTITSAAFCSSQFPVITGWKIKEDTKVYTSEDLWELIDGAAEIFISYYFEDLRIAEYNKKDQVIRVELYRHKTPADAYGMYSSERMPDYSLIKTGSQGYKSEGVLNFLTGNYYIKIMSVGTGTVDESTLTLLAEKVNEQLAQPDYLPSELNLFPQEGKLYLSDNYIAQNYLGYSFFRSAFLTRYNKPTDFQLFIIHLEPDEIQMILQSYFQMIKEDKVQKKGDLFIVKDLFNGIIYLRQVKGYLIGVLDTDNELIATEYIEKVVSKIQ